MNLTDPNQLIEELFLLQRVAQKINSTLEMDVLFQEIVDDVSQTFGCSRLAVLLKDDLTNELVVGADCGGDMNNHMKGERIKIGEYGMVGHTAAIEETYYAPDVSIDPYYRVSDALTKSEVDIPLKSHGRLIGVLNAQHRDLDGFSFDRIRILEGLAGHIATAIENARLLERERLEKDRMAKELREAQRIQMSLFPDRLPEVLRFSVDGICLPCLEVGGDWYDYISLPDGRLGLVLADVSGKGMGAALLMSSTRTVLRLIAESGKPPGEVLRRVNHVLLKDFPESKFVTMVYALLDPNRETVTFASAGHPQPLLAGPDGTEFLETNDGLPLGIREGLFSERTIHMSPGSRMILYSDGVIEAMSSSTEQYGTGRLQEHFANASASIQSLMDNIRTFTAGQPVSDDTTIVIIARQK